uniref:dolichyl-phosphate-mannose--protein mannosyltransferase n=1 Tax=Macrostomum lignano TaxID=282301 RepID=A0A1I8JF98_9PLAT
MPTSGKPKSSSSHSDEAEESGVKFDHHMVYVTILAAACYVTSLHCDFVFDDASAVRDNKDLRPHVPWTQLFRNDFWGTPMAEEKSHKSYRPLTVLTFRLNYALAELAPFGYHLGNVGLHALVSAMFLAACRALLSGIVEERASAVAAYLFALHPVHTEAVAGLLSAALFLLALRAFAARRDYSGVWLAVLYAALGTLCKEQAITVVAVCAFHELYVARRGITLGQLVAAFSTGQLALRPAARRHRRPDVGRVMGAQLPVFTRFDNPAAHSPTPTRQLTFNLLLPLNLLLLLLPWPLCADWTMGSVPLFESPLTQPHLAALVLAFYAWLLGLVWVALRSRAGQWDWAWLCWPCRSCRPPTCSSFVIAERVLYLPSMGFCLLVGLGYRLRHRLPESVCRLGLLLTLIAFSGKTLCRNCDWKDEYSLFTSAVRVNPNNAKLWNNVGHSLEKIEKFSEALPFFLKAASVQPDDIGAHQNVARTYATLGDKVMAEKFYRQAVALMPQPKKGQSYTARVAPANLKAYEARRHYDLALQHRPDHADILFNIGVLELRANRKREALFWFRRALQSEPRHRLALHNAASVLQDSPAGGADRQTAKQMLEQLAELEPDNAGP